MINPRLADMCCPLPYREVIGGHDRDAVPDVIPPLVRDGAPGFVTSIVSMEHDAGSDPVVELRAMVHPCLYVLVILDFMDQRLLPGPFIVI